MNNFDLELPSDAGSFKELTYRLVYFKPSHYSDERIAIGLVAQNGESLDVRLVASSNAIELMTLLFGESGVEQFQFAASEMRRMTRRCATLDEINMPTELLVTGEVLTAFTTDRASFLGSALSSASALLRANCSNVVERVAAAEAAHFSQEVLDEVCRLDPFLGDRIFNHTVKMKTGAEVDVPILGDKIFGAPVSFASRDYKMRAEAYIAKFNWIRREVRQKPRMYVRAPSAPALDVNQRLERSVRELSAIAKASDVPVIVCDSAEEIAMAILKDEAA